MSKPSAQTNDDVHDAAALWYARLASDAATPADRAAFDAWIGLAPEHADAYAEACALASRFDAIREHPEIFARRVQAQLFEERQRKPLFARFGATWIATGLAAAAAAVAFFYLGNAPLESHQWATARGETKTIALSDGTQIVLGSDSRLETRFFRGQRDVQLDRGQAFFDVAHDSSRPFIVLADGRTVTALGTAFDVRAYANETTVTLVRGRVAIARQGESNEAVLNPGQQFLVAFGVASVRDVDASAETSWRTGVLEFDNVTLAEAIAEFNRSAPHSIVLSDPRLADVRVSGVFRANDPRGFATALAPAFDMTATQQSSGDIVMTSAD